MFRNKSMQTHGAAKPIITNIQDEENWLYIVGTDVLSKTNPNFLFHNNPNPNPFPICIIIFLRVPSMITRLVLSMSLMLFDTK